MAIEFDNSIDSKVKFADDPADGVPDTTRRVYNRAEKSIRPPGQTSLVPRES